MGGKNSTRWKDHQKAPLVEDALELDVMGLTPALQHDQIDGILSRSSGPEDDVASRLIFFLGPVSAAGTRLLMIDPGDNRRKQPIHLEPAQRGWYRSWLFVCPADCGRRARRLYAARQGRVFYCRCCSGLAYRSTQQHDSRLDLARRDPSGFLASRARAPKTLKSQLVTAAIAFEAQDPYRPGRSWGRKSTTSGTRAFARLRQEYIDRWGFAPEDSGRIARGG